MTEEKLKQVYEKLDKDYQSVIKEYLNKDKVAIINDAYRIAHYNEIADYFDCVDAEYPPFDDDVFDSILNRKDNIFEIVFQSWMSYSHPERYNFFSYEDLGGIIEYAVTHRG